MRILNVAVVGVDYAGRMNLESLEKIQKVRVQSVCDLNQRAACRVADEFHIPAYYADFTNMINNENLDFIIICTPPATHAPLTVKGIEANIHVLVEKPFTETTKQAMRVLDALRRAGNNVKVGVIHDLLFHRLVRKARNLVIEKGEIGHLLNMTIIRTDPFVRDPFISNQNHWCHKMLGARIGECLPHHVYLAQEFMNDLKVRDVYAKKLGDAPWVSVDEVKITLQAYSGLANIYW